MKDISNKNILDNVEIKNFSTNSKPIKQITKKKKRKKKKKEKTKILILVIVILLIILILLFLIINYNIFSSDKISLNYSKNLSTNSDVYMIDVSKVVEKTMPSLVAISCKSISSNEEYGPDYFKNSSYTESSGSGIIVGKSSSEVFILTNYHVIENVEEIRVQFINGKDYIANIKGLKKENDIALLSINLSDLDMSTVTSIKVATIGNSKKLKVGNGVIAIGNSLGYGLSTTTGVISALNRKTMVDNYNMEMIQIDATINVGNSGGALLNNNGEVIGIVSAKYSTKLSETSEAVEGIGFAIPISSVDSIITKFINSNN